MYKVRAIFVYPGISAAAIRTKSILRAKPSENVSSAVSTRHACVTKLRGNLYHALKIGSTEDEMSWKLVLPVLTSQLLMYSRIQYNVLGL